MISTTFQIFMTAINCNRTALTKLKVMCSFAFDNRSTFFTAYAIFFDFYHRAILS